MNFAIALDNREHYAQCRATDVALKLKDLVKAKEKLDPFLVKEIVQWIDMEVGKPLEEIGIAMVSQENMIERAYQRAFRMFVDMRGNVYFEDFLMQHISESIHANRLLNILGG
ncbi:MAG: hypothetical protein QXS54_06705 [Candidatus Methanomethylicaceae archaeon]